MQVNDRIMGIVAVLGGIGVIAGTLGFREVPGQQFGSAFFPRILGAALIVCGIAPFATAAKGRLICVGEMLRGRSGLQVLAVLVGIVAWVYVSPGLGFIATTAILIAALAILAGGSPMPSVATGIGMTILLFLIFARLLRVPLPFGFIEGLLT